MSSKFPSLFYFFSSLFSFFFISRFFCVQSQELLSRNPLHTQKIVILSRTPLPRKMKCYKSNHRKKKKRCFDLLVLLLLQRLRQVVQNTLEGNGIDSSHPFYESCTGRLYSLCKSFLKVRHTDGKEKRFAKGTHRFILYYTCGQ